MFSRNGSVSGGVSGRNPSMPTTIRPKKKPAPPRPPQPAINRLQTSVSFNQDLATGRNDFPSSRPKPTGKDLIDFSTPPGSPSSRRNTISNISSAFKDPNEFSYRVGASIFYVKSQLKNSASEKPIQNPFSPPRPSAETILTHPQKPGSATGEGFQGNINAAWSSTNPNSTPITAWDTPPKVNKIAAAAVSGGASTVNPHYQNTSSLDNNNTIKSNYQNQSAWIPAGVSSSSNASSNRSTGTFNDFVGQSSQPRYGNVPEAGKKELNATLSTGSKTGVKPRPPTIIRPANKLTGQLSRDDTMSVSSRISSFNNIDKQDVTSKENSNPVQRNYYDVPPDEDDDDDFDEPSDSSFMSPPMPSEPPPPPPVDVAVDEWVNSTTGVTDYPDTYSDAEQHAYAIALYDFNPESEGDLVIQAGDLVYLLRRIDDSWFYGSCGGMEGMFPSSFVNVVVPLPDDSNVGYIAEEPENEEHIYGDALYDFAAETDSDLGLQAGEKIKILGRINDDWLYGEKDGTKGQFPAAFVEHSHADLPYITI